MENNLTIIFLTSALTILGGVIVYVTGQIITRFFIDPYQEYRKVIGEIAHALVYYANVSAMSKPERQEEASTAFRQRASLLRATAHAIPRYEMFVKLGLIPKWASIVAASSALIGLSNGVFSDTDYDHMEKHKEEIIKALDLPPLR